MTGWHNAEERQQDFEEASKYTQAMLYRIPAVDGRSRTRRYPTNSVGAFYVTHSNKNNVFADGV